MLTGRGIMVAVSDMLGRLEIKMMYVGMLDICCGFGKVNDSVGAEKLPMEL